MSNLPGSENALQILKSSEQNVIVDNLLSSVYTDIEKQKLINQVLFLNRQYPGGLQTYVKNAKILLQKSTAGINPYDGCSVKVPFGQKLQFGTPKYNEMENIGSTLLPNLSFVLVAGGLGERLGYKGIKLQLPVEITTETCYLEYYCKYILAYQEKARIQSGNSFLLLPLLIMTSGDTHEGTLSLFSSNNYFGLLKKQVTLLKQEKVPALMNNSAQFALTDDGKEIVTKPHGHGDIHSLLYQSGIIEEWVNKGVKWIVFFQDTNAPVFGSLLATLGVSSHEKFEVNTITVPRRPGEAVGGICTLTFPDKRQITVNVEYNQLDPLLRASVNPQGDVQDETGFSPFPGNTNCLIFAAIPYSKVLKSSQGAIPEFVNPKYKQGSKTEFKSPARLECMMQEYPKLLSADARVGSTQLDRWVCFSAVKNDPITASIKQKSTGFGEGAATGESDIYLMYRNFLKAHNVKFQENNLETQSFLDVKVPIAAKVVIEPSFAFCQRDFESRISKNAIINISSRSSLILSGNVFIDGSFSLDGALVIRAINPSTLIHIKNLKVTNKGCILKSISFDDDINDDKYRIRGYKMEKHEIREIIFDDGQQHIIDT